MFKSVRAAFGLFLLALLPVFLQGQAPTTFDEINKLYSEGHYTQAVDAYRRLLTTTNDASTRAKVVFNLGMTYQKLRQHDLAIEQFKQIFALGADDNEPGGSIMETNRNYRSRAQWEIGNSLLANGDYEGALAAYRTTRDKYPFRSWCGTCSQDFSHRYLRYEALMLDYLKRFGEASGIYLKLDHPRVAEIYAAAGQLDDLKVVVDRLNEAHIAEQMRKYSWSRAYASESMPLRKVHQASGLYEMEKSRNWAGLIKLALQNGYGRGTGARNLASIILARNAIEAMPWLRPELNKRHPDRSHYVVYEILGRMGTDESVGILKAKAAAEQNWWEVAILVRELGAAGKKGIDALNEIEVNAKDNLKLAIERFRKGKLHEDELLPDFPEVSLGSRLPADPTVKPFN